MLTGLQARRWCKSPKLLHMISLQEESLACCMTLLLPPLSSMHNLRYKTTLFSKVVLYLKLCIEDNGGRGRVSSKPGFLPANFIICKSLGELHHLLARGPVNILRSFLKTYFSLKVIILKSGASLQKSIGQSCIPIGQRWGGLNQEKN